MMTSRTEYRLLQRQDNADQRLTEIGCTLGLVPEETARRVREKYAAVEREVHRLEHCGASPSPALNEMLVSRGEPEAKHAVRLADLIRRPRVSYADTAPFDPQRPQLDRLICEQVEIGLKYQGYIERQLRQVAEARRLEARALPSELDYGRLGGLRLEAREKLQRIRPMNLGQASRISGVSPADIAVLMVWLEQHSAQETPPDGQSQS